MPGFGHRFLSLLLRIFFHLLYRSFAWAYDLVADAVSLGNWQRWVLSVLPEIKGPAVLELGHGPGHLLTALAAKNLSVFGLDRSPQMGCIAQHRLLHSGLQPVLCRSVAQRLPFASGAFQDVVATFPTEYIADPENLLEIKRLLAANGRLLVVPEARLTGQSLPHRFMAALFRITGQTGDWGTQLQATFKGIGFQVEKRSLRLEDSRVLLLIAQKANS